MSGCSLHAVNTSLKCPRVWNYFCMLLFSVLFKPFSGKSHALHKRRSCLLKSCLLFSRLNRELCSIIPQKHYTRWANLKWSPAKLFFFLSEQVLAARTNCNYGFLWFYYRALPIAEHSGLIHLFECTALFPARATKSRLAEHHVHGRLPSFLNLKSSDSFGLCTTNCRCTMMENTERLKDQII